MKTTILQIIVRTFCVILTVVALLVIALFGAVSVVSLGPSDTARGMFVNTVMGTSAAKFLARIYFTDEQINEMVSIEDEESEIVYTPSSLDLVTIAATGDDNSGVPTSDAPNLSDMGSPASEGIQAEDESASSQNTEPAQVDPSRITSDPDGDGIEYVKIVEETFNGDLLIVYDPSRLHFYSISSFSEGGYGKKITDIIAETGAVAAINGGGFYDPDGHGHGGMPLGPVIQNGTLISNYPSDWPTLVGMTADHKLMVGNMSPSDAISNGMVEGITFGPVLVSNGTAASYDSSRGGLNPRSAIGQRADGAILLLTINGRQPGSLGATFQETADLMVKYGAVNAANLDGGSSSRLFLNGEQLNKSSSLLGMRPVPNAIIVY